MVQHSDYDTEVINNIGDASNLSYSWTVTSASGTHDTVAGLHPPSELHVQFTTGDTDYTVTCEITSTDPNVDDSPQSGSLFTSGAASTETTLILNAATSDNVGSIETRVSVDASATIIGGYDILQMDFRDAAKNGTWTNDGFGCFVAHVDPSTKAAFQSAFNQDTTFKIYEAGTSNLVFTYNSVAASNYSSFTELEMGTGFTGFVLDDNIIPRVDVKFTQ